MITILEPEKLLRFINFIMVSNEQKQFGIMRHLFKYFFKYLSSYIKIMVPLEATRHHISEDCNLNIYHSKSPKAHIYLCAEKHHILLQEIFEFNISYFSSMTQVSEFKAEL